MNATDIRNEAAETAKRFTALSNQSAQLIAGMSHELRETLARECGEYVHWVTYPLFDMSRALEAIADGRQTPKPWIVEAVCWDRGYVRERLREYGKADTEENVDAVVEQLKPWTGPGSSTTIAESACEKACEAIDVAIEDAGLPDRNEE